MIVLQIVDRFLPDPVLLAGLVEFAVTFVAIHVVGRFAVDRSPYGC